MTCAFWISHVFQFNNRILYLITAIVLMSLFSYLLIFPWQCALESAHTFLMNWNCLVSDKLSFPQMLILSRIRFHCLNWIQPPSVLCHYLASIIWSWHVTQIKIIIKKTPPVWFSLSRQELSWERIFQEAFSCCICEWDCFQAKWMAKRIGLQETQGSHHLLLCHWLPEKPWSCHLKDILLPYV